MTREEFNSIKVGDILFFDNDGEQGLDLVIDCFYVCGEPDFQRITIQILTSSTGKQIGETLIIDEFDDFFFEHYQLVTNDFEVQPSDLENAETKK